VSGDYAAHFATFDRGPILEVVDAIEFDVGAPEPRGDLGGESGLS
jgi:hypothetical protein